MNTASAARSTKRKSAATLGGPSMTAWSEPPAISGASLCRLTSKSAMTPKSFGRRSLAHCSDQASAELCGSPSMRALLTDAGFVLEPDFQRLATGVLGQNGLDRRGE